MARKTATKQKSVSAEESVARTYEQLRELIEADERATTAIQILRAGLPDPDAAIKLDRLFVLLADTLSTRIKSAKLTMPARPNQIGATQVIDLDVVRSIVRLTNSLTTHLQANTEATIPLLAYETDWPAVASVDPTRDARRVLKEPEGQAAQWYKPLENLGTKKFFRPQGLKKPGIFHQIASDAAQIVYVLSTMDNHWRSLGLHGALDFVDTNGILRKVWMDWRGGDEPRESCIALRYYLYLALAPEPQRTAFRQIWRSFRVKAFAALQPQDEFGRLRYERLKGKKPVSVETDWNAKIGELASFQSWPAYSLEGEPEWIHMVDWHFNHRWADWWAIFLQHEPAAYFGGLLPMTEWEDPSIREVIKPEQNKGQIMSRFARCVDRMLDAYLHLCGVEDGLKSVQNGSNRFPKIPHKEVPSGDADEGIEEGDKQPADSV